MIQAAGWSYFSRQCGVGAPSWAGNVLSLGQLGVQTGGRTASYGLWSMKLRKNKDSIQGQSHNETQQKVDPKHQTKGRGGSEILKKVPNTIEDRFQERFPTGKEFEDICS